MAALHLAIATLLNAGDHIVASASLYGGTINLLAHTLPRFGITTTFVKPRALDEFRAAIKPNTRLVIGETMAIPAWRFWIFQPLRRSHTTQKFPAFDRQHLCDAVSQPPESSSALIS